MTTKATDATAPTTDATAPAEDTQTKAAETLAEAKRAAGLKRQARRAEMDAEYNAAMAAAYVAYQAAITK